MKKYMVSICCGLLLVATGHAQALTIDLIESADIPTSLLPAALLATSSGISITGTPTFQGQVGNGTTANTAQSATYTGFNLAPTSGSTPTLTLPDGIFLTSGTANIPLTNTTNNFNPAFPGTGSNAQLASLVTNNINDANALSFSFTVDAGKTSVAAQFVFCTDEFPTQTVTDIFGFFVDGVNYAQFPSGELISNTPGNPTNFISNPVGAGLYFIEYNGLTQAFNVVGLLDPSLTTHTLTVAVGDTNDSVYDSGVFIGGLIAGTEDNGGIDPQAVIPEPSTFILLGLGLGIVAMKHRRKN